MKNIVICCDGTSNDFGHENSNVVKLYSVLEKNTAEQTVYYDPGVGTPSTYDAFNPITRQVKHYFGKCFGYGLSDNIMEAYAFLMKTYEAGDQIYCFGFSRGAYTVRALAGLIDTCGLLHANSENLIPEAMRLYHDRNLKSVADEFKETFARKCPIHFLGLWDTVSFVGWIYNPVALQATANNKSVKNVRHAISIDERRAFFRQNLWGNRYQTTQDVKQVWFAGVHSDVGGSYPPAESALSNIALEWMLVEAREKELKIGEEQKAKEMVNQIPEPHLKAQHNSLTGCWPIAECWPKIVRIRKAVTDGQSKWVSRPYFNLGRPRFLSTGHEITLHESVLLRLQGRQDYRPKNLMKICSDIDAIPTHFYIEKWKRL
jgi:uncharacterized protein (DUF2235 family)